MYESGHSGFPSREDIRQALRRVEEALARHARHLPAESGAADPPLQILQRSVGLLREEADRLRTLLAQG
jgi:hypothetical protein